MNNLLKTPAGIIGVAIVLVAIIGGVSWDVAAGHDPQSLIAIIGTVIGGFVALAGGQAKIDTQTNGTLTAKEQQISALLSAVSQLLPHVDPTTAKTITDSTGVSTSTGTIPVVTDPAPTQLLAPTADDATTVTPTVTADNANTV